MTSPLLQAAARAWLDRQASRAAGRDRGPVRCVGPGGEPPMTRDEAIEAGARALFPAAFDGDPERGSHRARASRAAQRAAGLHMAAAVLDAIGWAEPAVPE